MSTACNTAQPAKLPSLSALHHVKGRILLLEMAVALGLLEAALWTEGSMRWAWSVAAAAWIIGATLYRWPTLRSLGMATAGFARSLWVVVAAAAVGVAFLFGAHLAGTLHPYVLRRSFAAAALGYLFWTLQQQFMLQSFFFDRLEQLLGSRRAVWAAAGLFAFTHIPNPVLVPATLAAGLIFCELFRRYRNIYTLAIAQAILGICLAAAVPQALHHHMRVGIGYLSWNAHGPLR